MTANIQYADGTDVAAVTAALDALNPVTIGASGVFKSYVIGSKVYFIKWDAP